MIRFRLFGIPVGIHLSFLLIALFGLQVYRGTEIVAWTLGVGLAVLFHELGHAITARSFRATTVAVTLFALGGYTTWAPGEQPIGAGRRFLIAASGSAVGIALGGSVLLLGRQGAFDSVGRFSEVLIQSFVLAALVWGIFNWLPVLPLDGGHMAQSALALVLGEHRALRAAKVLSVVIGIAAVAFAWIQLNEPVLGLWVALIVAMGLRSEAAPTLPAERSSPSGPAVAPADHPDVDSPIDAQPPEFGGASDPRDEPPVFPI